MGEVLYLRQFQYKTMSVPITIRDDGPKCWKQYTRGGKTFWRNYKRSVPGGISLVEKIGMLEAITRRALEDRLTEHIFG